MHQRVGGKRKTGKRKTRRGGYYGFNGALATGAAAWSRGNEMAPEVAGRAGNTFGGKRGRKGRKKTRRGGGKWGDVGASFTGTGSRGLANFEQIPGGRAEAGVAAGGQFNNFGPQPGDFSSFK